MAEEQIPPVVAVVVSFEPGPWLEACLDGLRTQDYQNLTVLVLDAASAEPLAPRVAAVLPDAYLRRLDENAGFGPSANIVTQLVEGSSYFCFCHDDVVLDPDAIRRMVEEAIRANAGIVAPKLVAYDEPDHILQLGLGVDRYGAPVRRVERMEFDQQQYDETQEVFAAPGGCTLVRSDLFTALGGFDEEISMFGEDVDLCWRARVFGARIIVAPSATVRHLEASAARLRPLPEARALQWRHELRAVLKNYNAARRVVIAGELLIWSVLEVLYFAVRGRRTRVHQVIDAWRWNFAAPRALKAARAAVREGRLISDREVARYLTRGSFRVSRFIGPLLEDLSERRRALRAQPSHPLDDARRHPRVTTAVVVAIAAVLFGSRSIIVGHLPLVGEYLPLPSPTVLIGHYLGGWQNAGLQRPGPASPAFAVLGILGIALIGAMGVLEKLIIVAAVVAGVIGVVRLVRPLGPPVARAAGAVAYLYLPLAWNDIGRGDLLALIAYGGAPFLIRQLLAGTGATPFGTTDGGRRGVALEVLRFGLLLALLASFVPALVVLIAAMAIALSIACLLLGDRAAALRSLAVTFSGVLCAFVLLLPWSLTFVQSGASWSLLTGAASSPSASPQLGAILRLELGPLGAGVLGLAFLAAALFVLVATDDARFAWAARLWSIVLGSAAIAWAGAEGWLGSGMGDLRVLAAPLAVGVATLVGLGVSSLSRDLRHLHLGWRHIAGVAFAILSVAGVLPVLGATVSGRWGLPGSGYDAVFDWTNGAGHAAASQETLWLGDPSVLPLVGWQIAPGLAAGVSSDGLPDGTRLFPAANPSRLRIVAAAIESAQRGATVRLGASLAPLGIRYVIVPSTLAPVIGGASPGTVVQPPQLLLSALTVQSDLHELPSEAGALIFENTAWRPGAMELSPGGLPSVLRTLAVVAELLVVGALLVMLFRRRRRIRRAEHRAATRPNLPRWIVGEIEPPIPALVGLDGGSS